MNPEQQAKTNPQLVAFDIEIARPIPDGAGDWTAFRPLGITCAATLTSERDLRLWHGHTPDGEIAPRMRPEEAGELVTYLQEQVQAGKTILTWNGLGFDFDILAEESQLHQECCDLAQEHIDMMFHFFCMKGFPLALDTAAKGMGLPGKPAGMKGDLAPVYWSQGRHQEVLDYVAQDVRTTLDLYERVQKQRHLSWTSQRGYPQSVHLPHGWMPVPQALKLPLPDTSWMRKPWKRSKFTRWMERV
jgi:hypothetical protein